MKKILGLDLGSSSIGWAVITETEKDGKMITEIKGLGSRIIPYEGTEGKDFEKGTGESRNSVRTQRRTLRKGYDRYQLRRKYLITVLSQINMMPDINTLNLTKLELWQLRNRAAFEEITLPELGRILLWLNQKRGYKSSRSDANLDKKDTEYVANVKTRHEKIKELGITVGQYFYNEMIKNEFFRVKENVFPREAYIEEFDAIWGCQSKYHSILSNCPDEQLGTILKSLFQGVNQEPLRTDAAEKGLRHIIRNMIIYHQRPLKSQKGLVSVCDLEGFYIVNKGKEYFVGPKVSPRSSPLFQVEKMWEDINNIRISKKNGEEITITLQQKQAIFNHLDNNETLTPSDLLKILNLKKENCVINKRISKGIKGNLTKRAIANMIDNESHELLRFDLQIIENPEFTYLYDRKTGEVINEKSVKYISPALENEPLYKVWHTIYSINDQDERSNALRKNFENFNIKADVADKLAELDFKKSGFGSKSVKAIRKILPYLMDGDGLNDAKIYAGYEHTIPLNKNQNLDRELLDHLKPLNKNSLRQPIVEKILNQMVNVVNAVIDEFGKPDEIRVELARELKQSKEERNETDKVMSKRQRENEKISGRLEEYGLRATRNNIIKWRLYEEMDNEEKKLNAMCIYCGQPISLAEAIKGSDVDVEHIIPKSRLFDDSQSNKTLAHRHCNTNKNDRTAYDFMKSKTEAEFNAYVDRVHHLYADKIISKSKRDKLLMSEAKIPENFIDRQIRETQYISKKAREILQTVCHNVWATSGNVTAELRYLWGWDDVTMNLHIPRFKKMQEETGIPLIENEEWESDHGRNKHVKERIIGWTKRDDHRHHAIDALTIACTKQGFIQRFNTLNASKTREEIFKAVEECSVEFKEKLSLLEKYIVSQKPIEVEEVTNSVAGILVSFKPGKRVAVKGMRKTGKRGHKKVVQTGIIVPRCALSEESVYGKIRCIDRDENENPIRYPVKYLFRNTELIFKPHIKILVEERLRSYDDDIKRALDSLKKDPLFLDAEKTKSLEFATCYKNEFVIKYTVDTNFSKVDKVIDAGIKETLKKRLEKFSDKEKEAFKDVQKENNTVVKWYEDEGLVRPIKSVRCFTGLAGVVPVKKDGHGNSIGFVKPGNNHHIAIYEDNDGRLVQHICTFWHAVERKKYGIPVIIGNSNEVWDEINESKENTFPESFLEMLPQPDLFLKISMQQNEMFILGLNHESVIEAIEENNVNLLSEHLYRLQKLTIIPSSGQINVVFRHHLETQIVDNQVSKNTKRYYNVQSLGALFGLQPFKVRINFLGKLIR